MSSIFLTEGKKWLEDKATKIENFFKPSNEEGYNTISSIMGPVDRIKDQNNADMDITAVDTLKDNLAQGITNYNTKYRALNNATNVYLGATANYGTNKNYNIYVNKPMDMSKIKAEKYAGGCVSKSTLNGLTEAGEKFDQAYPGNFPNTPAGAAAAINACKLWGADSQSMATSATNPARTYFAVTKDTTNKYKCYTGNSLTGGNPEKYTKKMVAYSLFSSIDATRGGLFYDGTIGIDNETPSATPFNVTSPHNPFTTTAIAGYTACDRLVGGGINPATVSATLGANCTNMRISPINIRYVIVHSSQDPNVGDSYIQISQLAVLAIINGVGTNVASKSYNTSANATSGNGANLSGQSNYGWDGSNPNIAIDGQTSSRPHPYGYYSASASKDEWWRLDLGREYSVYQINYYNRAGCCPWRAKGMTMEFQDKDGKGVPVKDPTTGVTTNTLIFKDDSSIQTFTISPPAY